MILIYFTGQKVGDYVKLGYGGDVSKMYWILKIGERNPDEYRDQFGTLTNHFYYDTLYGTMIPFVQRAEAINNPQMMNAYNPLAPWEGGANVNPESINPETGQYYEYSWMKFEQKPSKLKLVYASPGLQNPPDEGVFHAVMIYEVPRSISFN